MLERKKIKRQERRKAAKRKNNRQTVTSYRTVFQVIIRAACIVTHNQIFSIGIGFFCIEVNIQTIPLHVIAIMSLRAYLSFTFLNGMSISALYTFNIRPLITYEKPFKCCTHGQLRQISFINAKRQRE